MKKIAILASGEGTNAERIIRYFLEKRTAEVALVIVNKAQAGVLKRAERLSVPSLILTAQDFADGKALEILHQYHIDFIVLAGFLLKVPDAILHDYPNKIVNIHPALLPKFGGKEIISRDNEVSLLRKTEPDKAYYNCHTDITIPYDEIGNITVVAEDGTRTDLIKNGRFVLDGTLALNDAFLTEL